MDEYERLLATMPPGLERAVLRILSSRVGKENAVKKPELVRLVRQLSITAHERQVRACVAELRKQGHLICAVHTSNGGYFVAANLSEVDDFLDGDLNSRIRDMAETVRSMKSAAHEQFGEGFQVGLFG